MHGWIASPRRFDNRRRPRPRKASEDEDDDEEPSMPFIEFRDALLGYGRRSVILSDVGLRIERGEFWGIVGPNGSGKTTLLKTLLGLLKPVGGIVNIGDGAPLRFGYVPQRETVDTLFPITVEEIVVMGRYG